MSPCSWYILLGNIIFSIQLGCVNYEFDTAFLDSFFAKFFQCFLKGRTFGFISFLVSDKANLHLNFVCVRHWKKMLLGPWVKCFFHVGLYNVKIHT